MHRPSADGGEPAVGERVFAQVLVFRVDGAEHALPIESVLEVADHRGCAGVPGSPAAVEGIVALRGRMVTLIDLRVCLERPARPRAAKAQVVVIGSLEDRLGLVVDDVLRVAAAPHVPMLDLEAILRGVL